MAESESPLDKYNRFVNKLIKRELGEMDERVKAIDSEYKLSDIVTILSEANSLISFAVGEDEDLYELWRYRLFVDGLSGNIVIIQGNEVDIDFRELVDSGRLTELDEDEDIRNEDCDDDEDEDKEW